MSALTTFENKDFQTLTIWKDDLGREFYRAIDVCSNLRHSNPTQALSRHVNPKYIVQVDDGTNRAGKTNYLSEPGLYQLVFASKTEWAVKFQEWVFEDVLPKLRSQGNYDMNDAPLADLININSLLTCAIVSNTHMSPELQELIEQNPPHLVADDWVEQSTYKEPVEESATNTWLDKAEVKFTRLFAA
jgi:prophage antirepressor-like protein